MSDGWYQRGYYACCEHCDCECMEGHEAPCLQCQIPWHAGADLDDDEGLVR